MWFLWLFGGLSGRKEINVFLRTELCPFRIMSFIFFGGGCIVGVWGSTVTKILMSWVL